MLNSGTQLGWGVMNQEFELQVWTVEASTFLLVMSIICWHISVAFGSIFGSLIHYKLNVRAINVSLIYFNKLNFNKVNVLFKFHRPSTLLSLRSPQFS